MMSYKATSFLGESNLGCLLFCPVHFLKVIGFIVTFDSMVLTGLCPRREGVMLVDRNVP